MHGTGTSARYLALTGIEPRWSLEPARSKSGKDAPEAVNRASIVHLELSQA